MKETVIIINQKIMKMIMKMIIKDKIFNKNNHNTLLKMKHLIIILNLVKRMNSKKTKIMKKTKYQIIKIPLNKD